MSIPPQILCLASVLPTYAEPLAGPDQHCRHCSDAEELRLLLKYKYPDLILSDFLMPGLNLEEVQAILKEAELEVPLIVVRDDINAAEVVTTMSAGAADCIASGETSHLKFAVAREIKGAQVKKQLREKRKDSIRSVSARLAHDFNNILAPVTMSAPMLKWDLEDAEFDDIIDTLEQTTQAGAHMIRDLLIFGRGVELHRSEIQVAGFLEETIEDFRKSLPPNIHFEIRMEKQPATIFADPERLKQSLLQILLNAKESMPAGGMIEIRAEKEYSGEGLLLSVSDQGEGISGDHLEQIFDPYFSTKKHLRKGAGLGLSVALGLIKSHGGNISADSIVGKGSLFRISLPSKSR